MKRIATIEEDTLFNKQEPRAGRSAKRKVTRTRRRRGGHDMVWNILTVFVWLGMASVVMAFFSIYANPQILPEALRPVPPVPPTLVAAVSIPTSTVTSLPSATPKPTEAAATATSTKTPTVTITPSPTVTETSTPGPSPTATIFSLHPFIVRGEIKVLSGSTFPDHEECKLWVAGQAYDLQGAPMQGITVMLGGSLGGKSLYQLSLTGTALQYGQAGYEFTVSDTARRSKQSVWVMLLDQAMIPLSGKVYFDTTDDCSQNLFLVNFRQIR